jgi:hypothetical protein
MGLKSLKLEGFINNHNLKVVAIQYLNELMALAQINSI